MDAVLPCVMQDCDETDACRAICECDHGREAS